TNISALGNIYYQTLGTAPNRTFVVEWINVGPAGAPGITFETILYENSNDILFQYNNVTTGLSWFDNGASATVGIGDPFGTIFLVPRPGSRCSRRDWPFHLLTL